MSKEQIEAAAKLLDLAAGTADERNLSNSFERGAKQLREAIAQLEKAPEPVYQTKRIDGVWCENDEQGYNYNARHGHETRILYTAPPDVTELVKQNVELLHRVVDLKSLYESANKANEQAHVALAESQHKVTDLEKQVQALQAENKRLKNEVPEDPMDWRLPCSVTVGHGTIGKGCKLRTLVMRMQVLYEMAHEVKKS